MKKFKILSLILALTLVFASMSTVAFAATTETPIVADINELNTNCKYRVSNQAAEEPKEIVPGGYNGSDYLKFYTDGNYSYTTKASYENAIQFFTGSSNHQSLGGLTWADYDSLKIETAIYIGDTDDGLGFRFRRYANGGKREYEIKSGTQADFFVGVGGSTYSRSTVTDGYSYEVTTLNVGWNTVVIEIGSTTTDVKITVNDSTPAIKARMNVTGSDPQNIDGQGLPEGTYGFCGSRNRTVLLPKSKSTSKLDVRVANFKMYAVSEVEEVVEVTGGSVNHLGDEKERTTGYVKYINTTNEDKEIVVVIANYDANHNLIKAEIYEETLPANTAEETTIRNDMETATTGTVSYSKQFVWENIDGDIVPLYESMRKNY